MIALLPFVAHASETITFDEPGLTPGIAPDACESGSPKGTVVMDQFEDIGVLFSGNSVAVHYVSDARFDDVPDPTPGGSFLSIRTLPCPGGDGNPPAKLTVAFVEPEEPDTPASTSEVSVFVHDAQRSVAVRTFDVRGRLLEEQWLTTSSETLSFAKGEITVVEFIDVGGDGHVIDDLSFGELRKVAEGFLCYDIRRKSPAPERQKVTVKDQFGEQRFEIMRPRLFCVTSDEVVIK